MATPFENFVSLELPKRLATNEDPLTVPEGMVPVTTGVGLLTTFKTYNATTDTQLIINQNSLAHITVGDITKHRLIRLTYTLEDILKTTSEYGEMFISHDDMVADIDAISSGIPHPFVNVDYSADISGNNLRLILTVGQIGSNLKFRYKDTTSALSVTT